MPKKPWDPTDPDNPDNGRKPWLTHADLKPFSRKDGTIPVQGPWVRNWINDERNPNDQ